MDQTTVYDRPGVLEQAYDSGHDNSLIARRIVEAIAGCDDTDSMCNITTLLAYELLAIQVTDDEQQLLAGYLETGDDDLLLPIARRSLEHILPADVDLYPRTKELMVRNFSQTGLKPLIHLATSLADEVGASADRTDETIDKIARLQLACSDFLGSNKLTGRDLEAITSDELAQNQDNLAALARIAEREGVSLDTERLMRIQPAVFEMLTSNGSMTTRDINYRKRLNARPGAAHSLQAPESPNPDKLLSRYGSYMDFVEATAATRRGGYASTFGFLHRVGIDQAGNPFIVEHPHTMFDGEILGIEHPVIAKLINFERDFQRTHDMLHNALPVYAEHFMIHHPSAPVTLGGYIPEYVTFGKGMRMDKSSYELGLAILHKQIMQDRFDRDPLLLAGHVATVHDILSGLADMQARGLCPERAVDHISFVVMSAAANILPIDGSAYQELAGHYEQLQLPPVTVHPRDIYKLLIQQEVVAINGALRTNVAADATKDQMINQVCQRVDDVIALNGLQSPDMDFANGEQGAECIIDALREMGIEPIGMNQTVTLYGRDRLRWIGITASSRRLKGLNEKIHGLRTVRFWDDASGMFTEVTPIELLGKFYNHFEQHADEYEFRVWFRGLSNAALYHFKDLAFNPTHAFGVVASQLCAEAPGIIDKCISSLVDDCYEPLSDAERGRICVLTNSLVSIGRSDTALQLQNCMQVYEVLTKEAGLASMRNGQTFTDARQSLIRKLMTLDG